MRINHKSWDANGICHACRVGAFVLLVRWQRLWFALDYSPSDSRKEILILNVGPFRGPGEMFLKFWGGHSLNVDRYAWWHFPRWLKDAHQGKFTKP